MVNNNDWEDVPLNQSEQDDWEDQPIEGTGSSLETAQDFGIGAGHGLLMGGADELMGGLGAAAETGLGALGIGPAAVDEQLAAQGFTGDVGESFLDKYRGYQEATEQQQLDAAKRSPDANLLGNIGGSVLGSVALGGIGGLNQAALQGPKALFSQIAQNQGKAKAALDLLRGTATTGSRIADAGAKGLGMYAKASPYIAAESALTSQHDLIGDEANTEGVLSDVANGQLFGAGALVGLNILPEVGAMAKERVGKRVDQVKDRLAKEFADEDNPRLRQMAKSFTEYGQNLGVHPRSHANDIGGLKFSQRDSKAATSLLDTIDSADSNLGKQVGDSIEKATQRGAVVDIGPDVQSAANRIMKLQAEIPGLGDSRKSAMALDKILNGGTQLTPTEIKNLIDDLDAAIGTFKSATNKDPAAVSTLSELTKYRKSISNTFKSAVPEYAQAAERFESFRNVLEQIVSGDRPAEVTDVFYGSLRNQDQKVYDKLIDMVEHVQRPAQSSQSYRTAFTNFMDSLEKFEQDDLKRGAKQVLPSSQSIRKFLLNASDDSVLRGSVRSTTESRSVVPDLKEAIIGKAPTSGAYLAGKATKTLGQIAQKPLIKGTAAMTKAIYNAPAQAISNLASKLETSGNFKGLGQALRMAVENGDTAKKNAALFTIMQNPNARMYINNEDFPEIEQEE